jgi:DUF1009 family protein
MKKVKKIAIFAGAGFLPRHVYDACVEKDIDATIIGLEGQTSSNLFEGIAFETFPLHSVTKIINVLKEKEIEHIVLAGKVCRSTNLSKLLLDIKGAKLLAKIMRHGLNDNSILTAIIKFLESEGFSLVPAESIAKDLVVTKGALTKIEPSKEDWNDIKKGIKILKDIAQHDIGQSLVIQRGLILGIEAAEGTDSMISRCGTIKQKEESGPILVKAVKPKQDRRVDLPCIGAETILKLYENGFRGIAVESKVTLLLEGQKTIEEANSKGIFIYGI